MHHDEHTHPHAKQSDSDVNMTYYQRLETAVYELLTAKGVFSGDARSAPWNGSIPKRRL